MITFKKQAATDTSSVLRRLPTIIGRLVGSPLRSRGLETGRRSTPLVYLALQIFIRPEQESLRAGVVGDAFRVQSKSGSR